MGTIVVGLDGSETARAAFAEAIREAEWREADVLVLYVLAYSVSVGVEVGVGPDLSELKENGEARLAAELARLEAGYEGGFSVKVEPRVVFGHAGAELIHAAENAGDGGAELVVLGTRGLGGFRGLLLGSITTYAVHHLKCRLLIVPALDEKK